MITWQRIAPALTFGMLVGLVTCLWLAAAASSKAITAYKTKAWEAQGQIAAMTIGAAVRQPVDTDAVRKLMAHELGLVDSGFDDERVQILTSTHGQWQVACVVPERSETALINHDAVIGRVFAHGRRDTAYWIDQSGVQWRSVLVPCTNQQNEIFAWIEVLGKERIPTLLERHFVNGWIVLAGVIGTLGWWMLRIQIRNGIARNPEQRNVQGNVEVRPQNRSALEVVPNAASQSESDDQTGRRARLKREIDELRIEASRYQAADRTKASLLVALCRSLRSTVEAQRSVGDLLLQTRIDRIQREYVDSMQTAGGDLQTRINDVLNFALLDAKCLSLDLRPLRPRQVLEEAMLIVAERYSVLPIELVWYADDTVPERMSGDIARIRQVLVNLIGLAVSIAEEGTIAIHALVDAEDRLMFRISLKGMTVNAERMSLLLEGAISSDSSAEKLQGDILGLVLGKRIAQAMGGSLQIERGVGESLELVCRLRVKAEDIAPERPFLQRRVVVCHELPATRRMLIAVLERAGALVETVDEPQEIDALIARSGTAPEVAIISTQRFTRGLTGGVVEDTEVTRIASQLPLLVVIDSAHRGYSAEMRALGACGLLTMPIRQDQLLNLISEALSGILRSSNQAHSVADTKDSSPRVLIVEDNQVNQLVLVRMMQSFGLQADLVENGLQAVERLRSAKVDQYELVLMDIMMPVMDGIEATRVIRQSPKQQPPVWIIAVTANSLINDRARCIAAGMDDYLPKPITPLALSGAVSRWRQATGRSSRTTSSEVKLDEAAHVGAQLGVADTQREAESSTKSDFSGLRMLVRLAGKEAVHEVVECFLREVESLQAGVMTANGDAVLLRAAAHKLKGSSGTVGLRALEAHAASIELLAKAGELLQAEPKIAALPAIFATGVEQLKAFRDEPGL